MFSLHKFAFFRTFWIFDPDPWPTRPWARSQIQKVLLPGPSPIVSPSPVPNPGNAQI